LLKLSSNVNECKPLKLGLREAAAAATDAAGKVNASFVLECAEACYEAGAYTRPLFSST
jgi:hypothetical protein